MKKFDLSSMFFGILALSVVRSISGIITMFAYSINSDMPRMQYMFLASNLVSLILYVVTLIFLGNFILKGVYRTSVLVCTILMAVKVTLMTGYTMVANITRITSAGLVYTVTGIFEQVLFLVFLIYYLTTIAKSDEATAF